MKKFTKILALLAIIANAFIATAGSINYGCTAYEHIYTVVGVLNFIGWAYIAYRYISKEE